MSLENGTDRQLTLMGKLICWFHSGSFKFDLGMVFDELGNANVLLDCICFFLLSLSLTLYRSLFYPQMAASH